MKAMKVQTPALEKKWRAGRTHHYIYKIRYTHSI